MRKSLDFHNEATEEEDTLRLDSQLEGIVDSSYVERVEPPREFINVEGPISKLASRIFVTSGSEETEETSLQTLQEADFEKDTTHLDDDFLQKRKLQRQHRIESSKYQFEMKHETDLMASCNSSVKISTDRKVSTFSLFSVLKSPPLLKRQDGSSAFFTPAPVDGSPHDHELEDKMSTFM